MRKYLPIFLLSLSIIANAQESSVASRLREAYLLNYTDNGNFDDVKSAISGITEKDILAESDSIKYFFYYISAAILEVEERDLDLRDRYINVAIALREKSVGVLSSEYLELLWTKSTNLIEYGREDEAMRLCQKGLVMGHEIIDVNYPAARICYGRLMQTLGSLYISKGWHDQVISLYNESFDMLQGQYDEDDPTSWLPLLSLFVYYYFRGMYEEAYQTNERLGEHIKANGGEGSRDYAGTYKYQRGNALRKLGRIEEASESYREGVDLLIKTGGNTDEDLVLLYSNWLGMLVENGMFQKAGDVEEAMVEYCEAVDNMERLATKYWNLVSLSIKLGADDKTLEYIGKLEQYFDFLSDSEKENVLSIHGNTLFKCKRYDEAVAIKQQALAFSTSIERQIINSFDIAYLTLFTDEEKAMELYNRQLQKLDLRDSFQLKQYETAVSNVAFHYQDNEEYDEGQSFLTEQMSQVAVTLGKKNRLYYTLLNSMAGSYLLQGKAEDAISFLEEARKGYICSGMNQTEGMATVEHNLGRAYMLCGKYKKAHAHLAKSAKLQQAIDGHVVDRTLQYLREVEEMR